MLRALPVMGRSGTVGDRLRQTHLKGRIRAKTGSMHDISSLSGFIDAPHHSPIIFSIIINNINGNIYNAKHFEDNFLLSFVKTRPN